MARGVSECKAKAVISGGNLTARLFPLTVGEGVPSHSLPPSSNDGVALGERDFLLAGTRRRLRNSLVS